MVKQLSGDNAQAFIDMIDEASIRTLSPSENGQVNSHPNPTLSVSRWIGSKYISAEGICVLYTGFVAVKPCFHGHW